MLLSAGAHAAPNKILSPIPTASTKLSVPADSDHFTFVVSGDNRSTGHGYPMPPALEQICREIGIVRPSLTLWTGDCIQGYGDTPEEANAEYDTFLKSAALTMSPVYNAPGNHEFSLDAALLPVYVKRMGALYGSFDYGNSHFIALNSVAVGQDGTITAGTLDDAQWAWLESDLKSNAKAKNTFVFLHHFVFGPPDEDATLDTGWKSAEDRDRVHALFVKYGVRAVFCGHNHIYWHGVKDGVDYYISGGAGAPLDADPEHGGYLHFVVVNVDGGKFTTQILEPWHLLTTGGSASRDGKAATVWVENSNSVEVDARGIAVHLAVAPGTPLAATAVNTYKGKTKTLEARIVSVEPDKDGKGVTATVAAVLPHARTTEITVSVAAK